MPFSERKDYFAKQILNKTVLIPLFIVLCTISLPSAFAATVNLAWNASTGSNIAGYKMYYGTSSRNYAYNVTVGKYTSCSISGLTAGEKYYFAATAYNTSNVESVYSSEIAHTVPTSSSTTSTPSGTIILDNGAAGTKASGSWKVSSVSGYYGSNSLYTDRPSDTYSFEAAGSGSQDVYLWWTEYSNRCTNVPVEIYNGSTRLDTITVNQRQNGGRWNKLGTFSFSGKAKVITISNGGCITSADAFKVVPSGSTSSTTSSSSTSGSTTSSTSGSSSTVIIDNGGPGTKASGSWKVSSVSGYYGSNSLYSDRPSDTYSFEAAGSGSQEVYLWWTEHSNRCANVPVEIYNGSTHLDSVTVNQRQNGGRWNKLGTFSFSGKAKVITISKGGCITSADAFKVVPSGSNSTTTSSVTSVPSGSIILDNGDAGTKASGSWKVSSVSGFYGSNSTYSYGPSDTYSFEAAGSGLQEVYLWWTEHSNRCANVPVEIYDGSTYLDTITVNQRQNGGQWNELGTFSFGGKAKVIIISKGGCVTSADAINFFEPN